MFASDLPLVEWIKWYEHASAVFDAKFGYGKSDVLLARITRGACAGVLDYNKWYDRARRIYEVRKETINGPNRPEYPRVGIEGVRQGPAGIRPASRASG